MICCLRTSSHAINDAVARVFAEDQIYRIDHYLDKEAVQNLLALRFANSLFEPLWRRESVAHVQLTIAEQIGVEGRGEFYDGTGAMHDIVQNLRNHLLQLLCMVAMEPPTSLDANAVRGQYVSGAVEGKPVFPSSRRPRPLSRCMPRSTTGAGPACRVSCAPVSDWRSALQKSSSLSDRFPTRSSRCRSANPVAAAIVW